MDLLKNFFQAIDRFLHLQFEVATTGGDTEQVLAGHRRLIQEWSDIQFDDPELAWLKQKWVDGMNGSTATLGFPELSHPKLPNSDLDRYLTHQQAKLSDHKIASLLHEMNGSPYDSLGIGISELPKQWLMNHDSPLGRELNPEEVRKILFATTGHNSKHNTFHFARSTQNNYFMMSLNCEPVHYIGHGKINTLFNLSLIAHEIGHTTTPRNSDLLAQFRSITTESDPVIVNQELDSYRYELILSESISKIADSFSMNFNFDAGQLLKKRKAIQFNFHLLANRLNEKFFGSEPLGQIGDFFESEIKFLIPTFHVSREHQWIDFATLDKPISRLGYCRAYAKTFGQT